MDTPEFPLELLVDELGVEAGPVDVLVVEVRGSVVVVEVPVVEVRMGVVVVVGRPVVVLVVKELSVLVVKEVSLLVVKEEPLLVLLISVSVVTELVGGMLNELTPCAKSQTRTEEQQVRHQLTTASHVSLAAVRAWLSSSPWQ